MSSATEVDAIDGTETDEEEKGVDCAACSGNNVEDKAVGAVVVWEGDNVVNLGVCE